MWFPELFSRLDNYYSNFPEASISVCEVIDYRPANQTDHCLNYSAPDSNSFINIFIIALAPLPANIWTILHMDKLGRKFFLGNEFDLNCHNWIFIYFFPLSFQYGRFRTSGFLYLASQKQCWKLNLILRFRSGLYDGLQCFRLSRSRALPFICQVSL